MNKEIVQNILENSPMAFSLLVEKMTAKCSDLQAETAMAVAGTEMQKLLLLKTPGRHLFDFFDEERIFVWAHLANSQISEDVWAFSVYSRDSTASGTGAANRQRAEELAFEQAFTILEMKLKKDR